MISEQRAEHPQESLSHSTYTMHWRVIGRLQFCCIRPCDMVSGLCKTGSIELVLRSLIWKTVPRTRELRRSSMNTEMKDGSW
jgi:hypothetical protein